MSLLELLILIVVIGWLFGMFHFGVSSLIHVLLLVLIVLAIIRIAQGRRIV
jgi:hypothetical protein